eukprot:TRINITY_DN17638_c0_g1_i2.p1 TRINITY_DN17638_c0_g1~~TRINITY_DN17638_c0_g1_i2.p1  ORF type:complete len:738 (-),score=162.99 TRINITY_DN17638_c0_g1_i2:120-2333(-)
MNVNERWICVSEGNSTLEESTDLNAAGQLLPGEAFLPGHCYDVTLDFPQFKLKTQGTLYFTTYKFFFNYKDQSGTITNNYTCIPYLTVWTILLLPESRTSYTYPWGSPPDPSNLLSNTLEVKTKDLRILRFIFNDPDCRRKACVILEERAFWRKNNKDLKNAVFAFAYKAALDRGEGKIPDAKGCLYDVEEEFFKRQELSKEHFKLYENTNYSLCTSYPKLLVFPKEVTEEMIKESAKFRSGGRLPTICWVHPKNKATLSRCSQPMTGLSGYASQSDQQLVQCLYSMSESSEPVAVQGALKNSTDSLNSEPESNISLYIVDARSKLAAKCNWAKGGGYESSESYPHCAVRFMDIHNIHEMRKSFRAMTRLCQEPSIQDRHTFEQTGWLNHVKKVLQGSKKLAKLVERGKCILVHCSDGWDRTSQLVALTELLLDPYYRSLKGFGVLIQKEWLSFGHKFDERLGHGEPEDYSQEQSPIFIQFMDAVYQLLCQYPNWFEFNEAYLILILDHLYSGRFGTFLMDSEHERENFRDSTVSIWPWLASKDKVRNPEYTQYNAKIEPNCATSHLHIWIGYYERYKEFMKQYHEHQQQSLRRNKLKSKLIMENESLKEMVKKLIDEKQNIAKSLVTSELHSSEHRSDSPPQVHFFRNTNLQDITREDYDPKWLEMDQHGQARDLPLAPPPLADPRAPSDAPDHHVTILSPSSFDPSNIQENYDETSSSPHALNRRGIRNDRTLNS